MERPIRKLDRYPDARDEKVLASVPYSLPTKSTAPQKGNMELPAPDSASRQVNIRYVDNDCHQRTASSLVQRRYAWRGYQISGLSTMQPDRITLSGYDRDDAVATISVGLDAQSGLFVDTLFGEELNALRGLGTRVCEFTRLAINEALGSLPVIAALFHTAYIYARRIRSCTDLVVEVNPRHVRFYERMLGFQVVGPARMDTRVQALAALLHLDLAYAEAQIAEFGGTAEYAPRIRSLYPFFFSPQEERGIESRFPCLRSDV